MILVSGSSIEGRCFSSPEGWVTPWRCCCKTSEADGLRMRCFPWRFPLDTPEHLLSDFASGTGLIAPPSRAFGALNKTHSNTRGGTGICGQAGCWPRSSRVNIQLTFVAQPEARWVCKAS